MLRPRGAREVGMTDPGPRPAGNARPRPVAAAVATLGASAAFAEQPPLDDAKHLVAVLARRPCRAAQRHGGAGALGLRPGVGRAGADRGRALHRPRNPPPMRSARCSRPRRTRRGQIGMFRLPAVATCCPAPADTGTAPGAVDSGHEHRAGHHRPALRRGGGRRTSSARAWRRRCWCGRTP